VTAFAVVTGFVPVTLAPLALVAGFVAVTLAALVRRPAAPVADFVPVTLDPLALAAALGADFVPVTLGAPDPVADFAATLALVFVSVIFVALAFVVVFLAAALVGAAFFGGTALLAAEVAFFTAMPDPFKMALRRPQETRTCEREDKAIWPSSQWRNAAPGPVSPPHNA